MTPTPPTATDSSTLLARGSLLSQRQQLVPSNATLLSSTLNGSCAGCWLCPLLPKEVTRYSSMRWSRGGRKLDRLAKVLASFPGHCPFSLIPRLLSIQSHSQATVHSVSFPDCCPFSLIPRPLSIQSHSQTASQLVSFPGHCPFSLIPGPLSSL